MLLTMHGVIRESSAETFTHQRLRSQISSCDGRTVRLEIDREAPPERLERQLPRLPRDLNTDLQICFVGSGRNGGGGRNHP